MAVKENDIHRQVMIAMVAQKMRWDQDQATIWMDLNNSCYTLACAVAVVLRAKVQPLQLHLGIAHQNLFWLAFFSLIFHTLRFDYKITNHFLRFIHQITVEAYVHTTLFAARSHFKQFIRLSDKCQIVAH